MANPNFLDVPLVERVQYASHVLIRCNPPSFMPPCSHSAIWLTSKLHAALPRCRTYGEFRDRLVCSQCGRRGFLDIRAARR